MHTENYGVGMASFSYQRDFYSREPLQRREIGVCGNLYGGNSFIFFELTLLIKPAVMIIQVIQADLRLNPEKSGTQPLAALPVILTKFGKPRKVKATRNP